MVDLRKLLCRKRNRSVNNDDEAREPDEPEGLKTCSWMVVSCRGHRFETTASTLMRLGPCYLTHQADISTDEEIRLDFSPASFQALLDVMTIARHDIYKALLQASSFPDAVADFEWLLSFMMLGWVAGTQLPLLSERCMPNMPKDKEKDDIIDGLPFIPYFNDERILVGALYHLKGKMPNDYDSYEVPDMPLRQGEQLVVRRRRYDWTAVSVEVEAPFLYPPRFGESDDDEDEPSAEFTAFDGWLDRAIERARSQAPTPWRNREDLVSSIHGFVNTWRYCCLGGDEHSVGLAAGDAVVVDLGPRCALKLEGLVFAMHQHSRLNSPAVLKVTVDARAGLDTSSPTVVLMQKTIRILNDTKCPRSPWGNYFRFDASSSPSGVYRFFRFKFERTDNRAPDRAGHPPYRFDGVELFGRMFEFPHDLHLSTVGLPSFTVEDGVVRVKRRRFRR
eukprot:TRINITY_DN82963_c0_g1_i1.p1 TRINITY_DN82963_c0_g1~~TRINITY_DN82963_c0_g1_i1.p1  ORF type:complete len:448 (+),score=8.58 TRINITY_DN82963_c0_g1_i1:21-1364(+)